MASTRPERRTRDPGPSVKPIYVVRGTDMGLVGRSCQELIDRLLEPDQRGVGLLVVDGKDAAIAQVLDELRTLPFLTSRRVVVVRGADDFVSDNRPLLERYFDAPCPSGVLVLAVQKWALNTRLAKRLPAVGDLIVADPPRAWEMAAQLVRLAAQRHGRQLTREAAERLVDLAGDDWGRLCSELEKLAMFADGQKTITAEHVAQAVGCNRLVGAFDVIHAATSGQTGLALQRLRARPVKDRDAEYTVVGAFAYHARRLFQAKALLSQGKSPEAVAKDLHLFWKGQETFMAQAQRLTLEQISLLLQRLAEIDFQIKTGRTRAEVAVERMVLGLAGPGGFS